MSTFSDFSVPDGHKEERRVVNGEVVKFNYPEFIADIYRYRETADKQTQASEGVVAAGEHGGVLPVLWDTSEA